MKRLVWALLALAASCGGGSTEPIPDPLTAPLTGTYYLRRFKGGDLPSTFVANGTTVTVIADTLRVNADGTWRDNFISRETKNGTTTDLAQPRSGVVQRSGSSVTFMAGVSQAYQGSFTGVGFSLNDGFADMAFHK